MKTRCDYCGIEFNKYPCEIREHNYCSKICSHKGSESQVVVICEQCGETFKRNPSELKDKNYCSRECFSEWNRGSNSSAWKGGLTNINFLIRNSTEYAAWRLFVFERDEFTCQYCGQVGGKLHAHHIKPFNRFPELRLDPLNGLTLCKECHTIFHSLYGRKSCTSDDLHEWVRDGQTTENGIKE